MSAALQTSFYVAFGRDLKVDVEKRVIPGFAVATLGPAVGHDEIIDEETLNQIVQLGQRAPVRCRIDHPDQVDPKMPQIANKLEKLVGFAKNFRRDGNVVRADCYVLPSAAAPLGDKLLALANSEAADFFGASMVHISRTDNKRVRVEELLALDFVDFPAANPSGLFSVGTRKESNMADPLKPAERDGKFYVMCEGKEYEVAMPAPKVEEDEEEPEVKKEDVDGEPTTGAMSATIEKARLDGVNSEREYRKAFNAAMTAGGLTGKDAEEFETAFYGIDIKQVKFHATRAIANRAKPVGEGNGTPDPKEKEKNEEKQIEEACAKRFEAEPQLVKLWSRNPDPLSEEYKAGLARYIGREKQWAKEQKANAQKAASLKQS